MIYCDQHCFRAKAALHWLFITKYNVQTSNSPQDIRQNHWTMKYRRQWPINILRTWCQIILTHSPTVWWSTLKSFQDIRQNHWTRKYRSQWPTFIFRSNIGSYWLIIPKYDVHAANSLQDIRQNNWTMNYRSQSRTLFFGQMSGIIDS